MNSSIRILVEMLKIGVSHELTYLARTRLHLPLPLHLRLPQPLHQGNDLLPVVYGGAIIE
jgi:hypothetical protein